MNRSKYRYRWWYPQSWRSNKWWYPWRYKRYPYSSCYPWRYKQYPYSSWYSWRYKQYPYSSWYPWRYKYPYSSWYSWRYKHYPYYFDDTYSDLQLKMNMFKNYLTSVPKNRSEYVNDLEIPEGILRNRVFEEDPEDYILRTRSDSLLSANLDDYDPKFDLKSALSTDSSLSLSRAMTDSECDFDVLRRIKNRRLSDPFREMRTALDAFPPEYLTSLNRYQSMSTDVVEPTRIERPYYNQQLETKMKDFFDEECRVFPLDDPGLLDLEEALDSIDLKCTNLEENHLEKGYK